MAKAAIRDAIAISAEKLRMMVADCETFRQSVQASTAGKALQRVHTRNVLGKRQRPHAIISPGDELRYTAVSGGSRYHLRPSGSLTLYLAKDTPQKFHEDMVQAEFDFATWLGGVMRDLADQSAVDDKLAIHTLDVQGWGENDDETWETLGRFYFAFLSVRWGEGS